MHETVLITGASSGIGRELAKLFAKAGSGLVLTARSEDKLLQLASELRDRYGIPVVVIAMDLAEQDASSRLVTRIESLNLVIDVLVNNAGFGQLGRFVELSTERQINMIRLNMLALTHLTRLLLPGMVQRNRGGVLNVASTAAFQPGPNMAVYYATKAYVLSFSEAIHEELIENDVAVSCLAPGPTKTGFGEDSGMGSTKIFSVNAMNAVDVAVAGYRAFRDNKSLKIPGVKNELGAFLNRLVPRFLVRKLIKRLQTVSEPRIYQDANS